MEYVREHCGTPSGAAAIMDEGISIQRVSWYGALVWNTILNKEKSTTIATNVMVNFYTENVPEKYTSRKFDR